MGKVFLLLLAAAACVLFYMKDKKGNAVENKAVVRSSAQNPAAEEKVRKLPPKEDSEFNPVPGSLAEQIVVLSKKPEFKPVSSYSPNDNQDHPYHILHSTKVNKSPKCKAFLKANATLLQDCRNLSGFSTLGVKVSGSPAQNMQYLSDFRTIFRLLCYSAEYNINFGNKKQGREDFEHVAKLLKTFCSGTACIVHFYTVQRCNSEVVNMINRLRISRKNKDELLSKLLERKDFAASLSGALNGETLFLLYMKKWYDVLPEILGIDPKAGKIPQSVQEIIDSAALLQDIPADRLEQLCREYNKILVKAFEGNTVDQVSPFNLGTEKENQILATNHYGVFLPGITRVSKSIK